MNKELNEIIEMLKADRDYYQQCLFSAFEYEMSDTSIKYYSNTLTYIESLIARIKKELELND